MTTSVKNSKWNHYAKNKRIIPLYRKIKYIMIIVVTFLLSFELFLRLCFPQPVPGFSKGIFYEKDHLIFLTANEDGWQDTREFTVKIEGNSYGYRKGTWPEQKKGKVIWLLGDSYAFGWGVEAKDTVSAIINKSGEYRIYNLAMPGDNIAEYLQRYKAANNIIPKPDAVIILSFDNDFSAPLVNAKRAENGENEYKDKTRWRTFLLQFHIIRLLRNLINLSGLDSFVASKTGSDELLLFVMHETIEIHKKSYFSNKSWLSSKAILEELTNEITQQNTSILFIRIVPPFILTNVDQEQLLKKLNVNQQLYDFEVLDKKLQELYSNYFKFTPNNSNDNLYYKYDMHLTKEGHQSLAEFTEKILKQVLNKSK